MCSGFRAPAAYLQQTESLRRLSRQVMTQLELRRQLVEFDQAIKELEEARADIATEKTRAEELLPQYPTRGNCRGAQEDW